MVIDSWEGVLRNTSEDGRRMIESAILSDPDDNRVGVVLVSEGGRVGDLTNLVDGIVTLSSSELDGRRLRTIVVNKLRGLRVKSDRALFSLDKGKFNLLANTKFDNDASAKPNILSPVPHTQSSFSTGSRDLDAKSMFEELPDSEGPTYADSGEESREDESDTGDESKSDDQTIAP